MDAEIAELSQRVLSDLVRLEDSRVMEDYEGNGIKKLVLTLVFLLRTIISFFYPNTGIEMATSSIRLNNQEVIQKYKTKELNQQQLGLYAMSFVRKNSWGSFQNDVCNLAISANQIGAKRV